MEGDSIWNMVWNIYDCFFLESKMSLGRIRLQKENYAPRYSKVLQMKTNKQKNISLWLLKNFLHFHDKIWKILFLQYFEKQILRLYMTFLFFTFFERKANLLEQHFLGGKIYFSPICLLLKSDKNEMFLKHF